LTYLHKANNSDYKNQFFESPPLEGCQKIDFGAFSIFGSGSTKIGFIMGIAELKLALLYSAF